MNNRRLDKNQNDNIFSDHNSRAEFSANLPKRHRIARAWLIVFQVSTLITILALSALLINVINDTTGYVAYRTKVDPNSVLGSSTLEQLSHQQLVDILKNHLTQNRLRTIEKDGSLFDRTNSELRKLVNSEVLKLNIEQTWTLTESISNRDKIFETVIEEFPGAFLQFRAWLSKNFILNPQSSDPLLAGVKTAILGSLWVISITIFFALPIGVGAAVYLEEYADRNRTINKIIQININNLAAVPSIIYGILGLTIFVRALEPITSGRFLGINAANAANGRTILAGGLTLAILVLPIIIINTQETLRAVPTSLREASYGIGATKWQTTWFHVLPNSIPGILTGTILAFSRAFGETAPLIVVGVSTYITVNPTGIFSKFTTLPAQIYQWTARPQDEWRNLAAAAIVLLLILLISLNAVAILIRKKYSSTYA